MQLEDEAEASRVLDQLAFSGSVGEVVRDADGGQDEDPLLPLTLTVNHQDAEVVASLFPLVRNAIHVTFDLR